MKKIFVTIAFLFLIIFANAQVLSGTITDAETDAEIPFASVVLYQGEEIIEGVVSNSQGNFKIKNITPGNYTLEISFIGYQTLAIDPITITDGKNLDLGKLQISPSNVNLGEVSVTEQSKTVSSSIDRKTYKANDFATAQGGTAVDVLNKLPSVSVDPDGVVSVRGTTDFLVYLDGKPTQMDPSVLLAQIASTSIENIDVITVPTAKYDANGKGGIINISTKRKGLEGLSVSENIMFGGAPWNNLTDNYSGFKNNDNRFASGFNAMWVKNKFSAYGSYAMNNRNVNGMRTGDARVLVDENLGVYKHMVAAGERPEWYRSYSASAGFDYTFSEKSALSGSYFFGKRRDGRSAFYIYNVFYADQNKNTIAEYDRNESWTYNPNTDNRYGTFHTANIDFNTKLNDQSNLTVSVLYEHSALDRSLQNLNYAYDLTTDNTGAVEQSYQQSDDTPLDAFRLSVDYETEFDNGNHLSVGIQPQLLNIAGGFEYDTLGIANNQWGAYSSLENSIDLSRNIYAGYVDYRGTKEKLSFIAGVRLEYTDQEINILDPEYFSLFDGEKQSNYKTAKLDVFPTIHLSYDLSDNEKLSLAGSRRISRPPVKNMAPFLYRRHLEVFVVGDPELKPEYLQNVELTFDKKLNKNSISLTGFYRGVNNAIFRVNTITNENQQVLDVIQEDVLIRSYTNSGNTHALGAELNANIFAGDFAKFFVGGSLYQFTVDSDIFGYQSTNQSTNWSLKANMNLNLTKTLKFTTDFDVKSATVTAQGQNDLFFISNSAFSYSPKKVSGLDFSLRVLDIFSTNVKGLDTKAFNSDGVEIFYQETEYHRQGPIVEFAINYAFNVKGKLKKGSGSTFGKREF